MADIPRTHDQILDRVPVGIFSAYYVGKDVAVLLAPVMGFATLLIKSLIRRGQTIHKPIFLQ